MTQAVHYHHLDVGCQSNLTVTLAAHPQERFTRTQKTEGATNALLSLCVLELPSGYDSSIVMLLITSRSAGEEFSPPRLRVTGELASVSSTSPPSVSIPKMV